MICDYSLIIMLKKLSFKSLRLGFLTTYLFNYSKKPFSFVIIFILEFLNYKCNLDN